MTRSQSSWFPAASRYFAQSIRGSIPSEVTKSERRGAYAVNNYCCAGGLVALGAAGRQGGERLDPPVAGRRPRGLCPQPAEGPQIAVGRPDVAIKVKQGRR